MSKRDSLENMLDSAWSSAFGERPVLFHTLLMATFTFAALVVAYGGGLPPAHQVSAFMLGLTLWWGVRYRAPLMKAARIWSVWRGDGDAGTGHVFIFMVGLLVLVIGLLSVVSGFALGWMLNLVFSLQGHF